MKKVTRVVSIAAFVFAVGTTSIAQAGDHSSMMKMDSNKDGMLSKGEMKGDKDMLAKFGKMDANADGMLDASEMGHGGKSPDGTTGTPSGSGTGPMNDRPGNMPVTP